MPDSLYSMKLPLLINRPYSSKKSNMLVGQAAVCALTMGESQLCYFPQGREQAVQESFPALPALSRLAHYLADEKLTDYVKNAIEQLLIKSINQVRQQLADDSRVERSGTTLCVALQVGCYVIHANLGGSFAAVMQGKQLKKLSKIHVVGLDERKTELPIFNGYFCGASKSTRGIGDKYLVAKLKRLKVEKKITGNLPTDWMVAGGYGAVQTGSNYYKGKDKPEFVMVATNAFFDSAAMKLRLSEVSVDDSPIDSEVCSDYQQAAEQAVMLGDASIAAVEQGMVIVAEGHGANGAWIAQTAVKRFVFQIQKNLSQFLNEKELCLSSKNQAGLRLIADCLGLSLSTLLELPKGALAFFLELPFDLHQGWSGAGAGAGTGAVTSAVNKNQLINALFLQVLLLERSEAFYLAQWLQEQKVISSSVQHKFKSLHKNHYGCCNRLYKYAGSAVSYLSTCHDLSWASVFSSLIAAILKGLNRRRIRTVGCHFSAYFLSPVVDKESLVYAKLQRQAVIKFINGGYSRNEGMQVLACCFLSLPEVLLQKLAQDKGIEPLTQYGLINRLSTYVLFEKPALAQAAYDWLCLYGSLEPELIAAVKQGGLLASLTDSSQLPGFLDRLVNVTGARQVKYWWSLAVSSAKATIFPELAECYLALHAKGNCLAMKFCKQMAVAFFVKEGAVEVIEAYGFAAFIQSEVLHEDREVAFMQRLFLAIDPECLSTNGRRQCLEQLYSASHSSAEGFEKLADGFEFLQRRREEEVEAMQRLANELDDRSCCSCCCFWKRKKETYWQEWVSAVRVKCADSPSQPLLG